MGKSGMNEIEEDTAKETGMQEQGRKNKHKRNKDKGQKLSARDLIAAVGNDLVAVHVGLRAGAGLPDDEREIVQKLAGNDLVRRLFNGGKLFFGHFLRTQGAVGARSSLFENAEGMDDLGGHRLDADADGEVVVAALGLCAPVFVCRDANLTHGIVFDAIFHCFFSFYYQIST